MRDLASWELLKKNWICSNIIKDVFFFDKYKIEELGWINLEQKWITLKQNKSLIKKYDSKISFIDDSWVVKSKMFVCSKYL